MAKRLAARHGLVEYGTDERIPDHARQSDATNAPSLAAFLAMDMDERWVNRSPRPMLETFPWFVGEGFEMIVDDLTELAENERVLAEGFRLLPRLVAPLLTEGNQAIWLVPTDEFRRRVFEARGSAWFPYKTSDPGRAMANLLQRDALFSEEVRHETARLGLPLMIVDGSLSLDELSRQVGQTLGLD